MPAGLTDIAQGLRPCAAPMDKGPGVSPCFLSACYLRLCCYSFVLIGAEGIDEFRFLWYFTWEGSRQESEPLPEVLTARLLVRQNAGGFCYALRRFSKA